MTALFVLWTEMLSFMSSPCSSALLGPIVGSEWDVPRVGGRGKRDQLVQGRALTLALLQTLPVEEGSAEQRAWV